ncbi:MAG: bifunctional metallophosphatase/5'-nucleotidase [Pseudomonadota bacterium]
MTLRFLTAGALVALLPTMATAEDTLTILHVNDVHSRVEPINRFNSTCSAEDDAEGKCFGGAARLVTAIREAREASENPVMVLDAGDQFQGSLFYSLYKGEAAAKTMNLMGFDAMALGNHEFNHGPETIKSFVEMVNFPVLFANVEMTDASPIAGLVPASTVIEKGGHRYGIIGIAPDDTGELSSPGETITFTDPVPAVQAEVDRLTADGIDRIILLSHSGLPADLRIGAAVTGVDIIVGGHSHTLLSNTDEDAAGPYPTMVASPDGETPIVQAGAYSKYLGKINVTFDDNGVVTAAVGDTMVVDGSVEKDAETDALVTELAGPLEELRNEVVGEAAAVIDGERSSCRARECEMGNLVADALLDRVADQGIQIAIQNGGGLRASIDAGPITMGEVLTVLPFQNTLATFQLSGAGVRAALENGVSQVEEGAGRFAQVAGLRYTADLSQPAGSRIVSVEVATADGFAPLDDAAIYGVVSNNFMRRGGDGYAMFADDATNAYDYGPGVEQVVADYMMGAGPITPALDGRITIR